MLRAFCIGRHQFLSDHLCRFFGEMGIETRALVGLEAGLLALRTDRPDVVICDYDLLVAVPLEEWERDPLLARVPVIAISLTRKPNEMQVLDVNGIAGLLYLPTLDKTTAARILAAVPMPVVAPATGSPFAPPTMRQATPAH